MQRNLGKAPIKKSLFTHQCYLQRLQADISGIQNQVLYTWRMGKSWNLKNCLPHSCLNNLFQIICRIWHELSHKCYLCQIGIKKLHFRLDQSVRIECIVVPYSVVTSGCLSYCCRSIKFESVWPFSSDLWHQQGIFTHRTAAHSIFSLFQIIFCKL